VKRGCLPAPATDPVRWDVGNGMHVLQAGPATAPVALLLHGLGSLAGEMMGALGAPLLARGFQVVAVDRPGYGRSRLCAGSSPAAQAEWLRQGLSALHLRPILVAAHSYGAAVALAYARAAPASLRLLLINPFCQPTRPAPAPLLRAAVAPLVGPWVRSALRGPAADTLVRRALAHCCAPDRPSGTLLGIPTQFLIQEPAFFAMARELRAFNGSLDWLNGPEAAAVGRTLVISGVDDRVIPAVRHGKWLARRAPQVVQHVVRGGHMLHHCRPPCISEALDELCR
jgi:pimeloyl-ACP methyl ester carboxylesterase